MPMVARGEPGRGRSNKSEERDLFFHAEVSSESCMRAIYMLKQGLGICAQPLWFISSFTQTYKE